MHHKQTFVIPTELIEKLDQFKAERLIRTRNQALTEVLKEFFYREDPKEKLNTMLNEFERRLDRIEKLIEEFKEVNDERKFMVV